MFGRLSDFEINVFCKQESIKDQEVEHNDEGCDAGENGTRIEATVPARPAYVCMVRRHASMHV